MRVSVFGLGYVGAVCAACLARDGHDVVGVDSNPTKVDQINRGRSPIIEPGIEALIAEGHARERLCATTDAEKAVRDSDISLVCVGTPSARNGSLDLRYVQHVSAEIGAAMGRLGRYHTVVIRSTVLPGTMRAVIIPTLEQASGGKAGRDFGVCFNPEFLREGTAIADYDHPPKTVVGESHAQAGDCLLALYRNVDAPVFRTTLEAAEMVKYVDNAWHALKVGFANEIGSLCKALGIDSFDVMRIFCADRKLNLSEYYLRPGFAFGGSCLPKDVRALQYRAKTLDVEAPILGSILASNEAHIRRGLELVLRPGLRRIGVLGFSFKAGTDDLRESPVVELIERLIGKGYDVLVYDRNVNLAFLTGANREYILTRVPHIANLMRERLEDVLDHAQVIVLGNADPEFARIATRMRPGQTVIDFVRLEPVREAAARQKGSVYEGICW